MNPPRLQQVVFKVKKYSTQTKTFHEYLYISQLVKKSTPPITTNVLLHTFPFLLLNERDILAGSFLRIHFWGKKLLGKLLYISANFKNNTPLRAILRIMAFIIIFHNPAPH